MNAKYAGLMAIVMGVTALVSVEQARADTVLAAGNDYLATQPGTLGPPPGGTYDYLQGPTGPATLFMGVPINPNGADTIINRQSDVDITTGGMTNIMITALSLVSTNLATPIYIALDPNDLALDTGKLIFSPQPGALAALSLRCSMCGLTFVPGLQLPE